MSAKFIELAVGLFGEQINISFSLLSENTDLTFCRLIWKLSFSGTFKISISFTEADTSYIPYVGGNIRALSIPGLQKILKQRSIISSLPFPRNIFSSSIPLTFEIAFFKSLWYGSGYRFRLP